MRQDKVQYLEGLRGLAAMQVVALHFVTAFMPITAEHAWPPFRLLFDGHSAVYVFFLISGAVLTPSLARPGSFVGKIAKRLVRLGLPVAAAAVIAFVLLWAVPNAHVQAAAASGSTWLATDSSGAITLAHLLREISLDSLLLGYRESTLFSPLADHLPLMETSLDTPFWSLHIELYGSLLILILVTVRAWNAWLHRGAIAASALAFATHPMFLFVLGHLAAPLIARTPGAKAQRAGAALLLVGCALCATNDWRWVETLRLAIASTELSSAPNFFQFQSQIGAVALFFGTVLGKFAWPLLETSVCRFFGRMSFAIYLLHFPILFTIVCVAFLAMSAGLPYGLLVSVAFVIFIALVIPAAMAFERWVDQPSVALSRRIGFFGTRSRAAIP
jgi:peptidoglycan/LPS O-acetylase OafA/YrhL